MTHHSQGHGWVAGSAPALLRLAHQLTGDPSTAAAVVAEAVSHLPSQQRAGMDAGLDDVAVRRMLRALPRRFPEPVTTSSLDRLPRRSRIAATLAFGPGWDALGIADATGLSLARVRTAVGDALAVAPQEQWEALLADARWSVDSPSLLDDVDRTAFRRRSDRRLRALGAAAVALAALGTGVAVVRIATAPPPPPATAHESGLLHWAPRGDLLRDRGLVKAAGALWRTSTTPPKGRVYVLWAGHVGVGRLVVLQSKDSAAGPAIAVVAEHDVSFGHPALRLDLVRDAGSTNPTMLVIPYDGNLNVAGLQSGPSQQVVQMLVRPGVDTVEQRSTTASTPPPLIRPSYKAQRLTRGMSDPWLVIVGDQPAAAVRASSRGRVLFSGDLGRFGDVVPVAVRPLITQPPPAWAGLPRRLPPAVLADDALWWTQVCHGRDPTVSLVWVSPQPPAARLEFVTCPGAGPQAQLLLDAPGGTSWESTIDVGRRPAVITQLLGQTVGGAVVVVVGDVRVGHIVVGSRRIPGRWTVVPATGVADVRVFDAHGRQLAL